MSFACAHRKEFGFTLMELLLVLSIIGMLAALLSAATAEVRRKARKSACVANLRQLGATLEIYLADNDYQYPQACLRKTNNPEGYPTIAAVLSPVVKTPEVFRCPADATYYLADDLSYSWNKYLNGANYDRAAIYEAITGGRPLMPILSDTAGFHGPASRPESKNFLYPDGRVGNYESQQIE